MTTPTTTKTTKTMADLLAVRCPKCGAAPGLPCRGLGADPKFYVRLPFPHRARLIVAERA